MKPTIPLHIVVTGPESSGKTTLSRRLATHYGGVWVPEYARHYLETRGPHYEEADLLRIAEGQYLWERFAAWQARRLVSLALSNGAVSGDYFPSRQGAACPVPKGSGRREHPPKDVTDEQRPAFVNKAGAEKEAAKLRRCLVPGSLIVSDTSMLVLNVWAQYRYGWVHPWIKERLRNGKYHLYLLCVPDLPWVADPLRENPHDRHELLDMYEQELRKLGAPFVKIRGADRDDRLKQATRAVDRSADL